MKDWNHLVAINRFIPHAVSEASRKVIEKKYARLQDYADAWNRAYHRAMDRMCKDAGLRV